MKTSINQISEWTGLDRRTVKKRLTALPSDADGQYDSRQALPLMYGSNGQLDPSQEKAKLDSARRELAELEFKKRRGELVSMETVFRVIESASTACREHLLTIPGRLAEVFAAEESARSIEATLNQEIRAALERITDVSRYDFGKQVEPIA